MNNIQEDVEFPISGEEDDDFELFYPQCDDKFKPYVDQLFDKVEDGVKFYEDYTDICGFISRKWSIERAKDGTITDRYVVCNREGNWGKGDDVLLDNTGSSSKKRKTRTCRVQCMARIIFKLHTGGVYRVRLFNEGHTHPMVSAPSRPFMKNKRKISKIHKMFLVSGIKANIGPMPTFRMIKEMVGTYDKVGCTNLDFKNWCRDLQVFINGSDAHMVLQAFKIKKAACDGFQYFYDVDGENQLKRLIWTDKFAVKNYRMFSEAVSFDATYNTNRYKMIFTPFTGRDNHGKNISFGAALISNEDMESYSWVLEKFVECMGNPPRVIVTDQDPGLKKAVAFSWLNTRHRFCMWHITMKVAEKLPLNLRENSDFKTEFGKIVWSNFEEPDTFDEKWSKLIDDYDLRGNKWFSNMFDDRSFWIPAYFKDVSMSGLFRTMSLSESENSYFKRFLNKNSDLGVLHMNYCSALDSQRFTNRKLNHEDESCVPILRTKLNIELHASRIYTNSIFKEVQEQIEWSILGCGMLKMYSDGEDTVHIIRDKLNGEFTVRHVHCEDVLSCSCKLFTRKGILCSHLFWVLRNNDAKKIPEKYICSRWCKSVMLPMLSTEFEDAGYQNPLSRNFHFFKVTYDCIEYVKGNDELSDQCFLELEAVCQKYAKLRNSESLSRNKDSVFEDFYGGAPPEKLSVLPPAISKTKGSGVGGRRKSNQEKAMTLAQKPMRNCRRCNTKGHHDSRNCPLKNNPNS